MLKKRIYPLQTIIILAAVLGGLFLFNAHLAHAGLNEWTSHGPYGGTVQSLVVDPNTPAILYAGTAFHGIFKSTDYGATWTATGLTNGMIGPLVIDPMTSTTLYAGIYDYSNGNRGLYKSTDGGNTWAATGLTNSRIGPLVIDPITSTTLYAGIYDYQNGNRGVYKSSDGGATWAITGLVNKSINVLVIDPVTSTTLYAGAYSDSSANTNLYKSTDGGDIWAATSLTHITTLAIDPTTPTILYAGVYDYSTQTGGMSKSMDGGNTWSASSAVLANPYIRTLVVDPNIPTTLYTVASGPFLTGTVGPPPNPCQPFYSGSSGSSDFYQVFKSTDGGNTWVASSNGLTKIFVNALVIDPHTPSTLYVGANEFGIFKSLNGGADWVASITGLSGVSAFSLAINPATPATLYAATSLGVFKSPTGGVTWSHDPGFRNFYALAINPNTPSTLYAGDGYFGIFKSLDGGANWTAHNTGLTALETVALVIDPVTPATLYAGTSCGVFKSTDEGAAWVAINTGLGNFYFYDTRVQALVVDPITPTTLYAGINNPYYVTPDLGVFKSVDGGATWTQTSLSTKTRVLAINPNTPTTLYAGTPTGVFKSTNSGADWTAINNGLTSTDVHALAIDPIIPTTLYAGTSEGVFKSTNGGATWTALNNGLTSPIILALAVEPGDPKRLYAGTSGGVFELEQSSVPTASVDIAGPATGLINTSYSFTATVSPLTTTLPVTYVWQAAGQIPVTHTGGLSDTVNFAWSASGVRVITVTATNPDSLAVDTHTFIAPPPLCENVLSNSSFEDILAWVLASSESVSYGPGGHTGNHQLLAHSFNGNYRQPYFYQKFTVPNGILPSIKQIPLNLFKNINNLADGDDPNDRFYAVLTTSPTLASTFITAPTLVADGVMGTASYNPLDWQEVNATLPVASGVNLENYAGQEVYLYFYNNSNVNCGPPFTNCHTTEFYFDDINLSMCSISTLMASVEVTGPTTGLVNTSYTFTATISPITATLPITYVWQTAGQEPVIHTKGLSDTVSFTWSTSGTQVISVTASNPVSVLTATTTITVVSANAPYMQNIYLPTILKQ